MVRIAANNESRPHSHGFGKPIDTKHGVGAGVALQAFTKAAKEEPIVLVVKVPVFVCDWLSEIRRHTLQKPLKVGVQSPQLSRLGQSE